MGADAESGIYTILGKVAALIAVHAAYTPTVVRPRHPLMDAVQKVEEVEPDGDC
jgi:hypothetical protein